jgi:Flp pilus assembly protein CpaB
MAVVTGWAVAGALGAAQAAQARWGRSRQVVVAVRAVPVGGAVGAGDVTTRVAPVGLVPAGALRAAGAAVGRTAVVALFPGEVVLAAHVAANGARGAAALVPVGRRAIAVPAGSAATRVTSGDLVDVLAVPASGNADAVVVATAAVVVDVAEGSVTVAVSPAEARRVATAIAHGAVALAVRSPEEPA